MNESSTLKRLISKWKKTKVSVQPPCSDLEINTFESRFAVAIPEDLKCFLRMANGTGSLTLDNEGYAFWSLREFKPVSELDNYESINWPEESMLYFCFMDWLVCCDLFAINMHSTQSGTNDVIRVFDKSRTVLARSFTEFTEKYLANPDFAL